MYPGSSGTVYFSEITKNLLLAGNTCILANMHMDLESAKPEVRMSSSSANQFSMEFIEVENGRGKKWRIDNSIDESFNGWVWYDSLWSKLKGLSSQVVVPGHGHEQGLLENGNNAGQDEELQLGEVRGDMELGMVKDLELDLGVVRDDLQLGMVTELEDSMDCEETSNAEPMDSQSNENLVVYDPKLFLTYKDGASYLKQKKHMSYPELAEKILLESQLAISHPLRDSDQRDEFIRATENMSQRLKNLMRKWRNNYRHLNEKDENEILFDLVSFSFFFVLKTYSILT